MRIIVDLATHNILQVAKTPEIGDSQPINGKYIVEVPEPSAVEVDENSYVLNGGVIDAGSVVTEAFMMLLASYPMFEHIIFNHLIIADDLQDIDTTSTFPGAPPLQTRAHIGRPSPDPQEGTTPNSVLILPVNDKVSPSKPGMIITDTINIGPLTGGLGAREFMVYWKIFDFSTSQDVASDYGSTAGDNNPAIRSIIEIDQEPASLEVSLSINDGANFEQVGRLQPFDFCDEGTDIRIAFTNTGSSRLYLASYALMF